MKINVVTGGSSGDNATGILPRCFEREQNGFRSTIHPGGVSHDIAQVRHFPPVLAWIESPGLLLQLPRRGEDVSGSKLAEHPRALGPRGSLNPVSSPITVRRGE